MMIPDENMSLARTVPCGLSYVMRETSTNRLHYHEPGYVRVRIYHLL